MAKLCTTPGPDPLNDLVLNDMLGGTLRPWFPVEDDMTRRIATVAVAAALAGCLSACQNTSPSSFSTGTGGFTLTISATTLTVAPGTAGTLTVTGVLSVGSTDTVALTSSSSACSLNPTSLTAGVTSAIVSCSSLTPGTTTVTISGLDQTTSQSASAQFTLIVS
jgi:hypothetical protein